MDERSKLGLGGLAVLVADEALAAFDQEKSS